MTKKKLDQQSENQHPFAVSQRAAFVCGALCLVIIIVVIAFGGLHPKMKKTLETHTHTVTFTCTRTCSDLTKIPEVFPWQQ